MAAKKLRRPLASPKTRKPRSTIFLKRNMRQALCCTWLEVRLCREGKVQLTDGYVVIRNGELFLIGCQIQPLKSASTHHDARPPGPRNCSCTKEEIRS